MIGAHVSQEDPKAEAADLKLEVVQMFLGDPQSFKKPQPRPDAEDLAAWEVPIFVHAPYRLNVCHPNPRIRIPSRKTLAQTVDAAAEIGAAGVIVHGGHAEDDPEEGIVRWWKVFDEREFPVKVLIENTAGGANAVARYVHQVADLWEKLDGFDVGYCFDTCHAHAAGEDLGDVVERLLDVVGAIDVVHLNDSRDEAGTGADRHANLGQGKMDPDGLLSMLKTADPAVVILETPSEGLEDDLAWLRENI